MMGSASRSLVAVMAFMLLTLFTTEVSSFSSTVVLPMKTAARYSHLYMETPPSASRFSTSLQPQHGKNNSKRPWAWMNASRNNESSSALKHTTSPNNNNKWQPSSFLTMHTNKRNLIAATVVLSTSAAVMATFPFSANAIDLASLTGGATELATSTTSWVQSLSETGFYQAFTLVFLSEIGDKTFFMAGLLAIQTSKFTSFIGSMAALAVMTIISVLIGQIFHAVPAGISQGVPLDDVAAVLAFAFFGFKTLQDAIAMDDDQSVMEEELEEAEETVEDSSINKISTKWAQLLSIFGLVFAAEFGDRSFLSTIALSAAQNPVSVAGGAIAAHAVATGIAVSGGSFVAKYVSEKVIGYIGGTLFLVFAATTAVGLF